jgi:hypothetical protein
LYASHWAIKSTRVQHDGLADYTRPTGSMLEYTASILLNACRAQTCASTPTGCRALVEFACTAVQLLLLLLLPVLLLVLLPVASSCCLLLQGNPLTSVSRTCALWPGMHVRLFSQYSGPKRAPLAAVRSRAQQRMSC